MDQAIALCSEMHNIKEAIHENKSKLEGIGEDYQIQVSVMMMMMPLLACDFQSLLS